MPDRVKEKLSDLLYEASRKADSERYIFDQIADYLIANGVVISNLETTTMQQWISVKDRLPKYTEEEMKRYRFWGDMFFPEFNVMILGAIKPTALYYDGERWYDKESRCYFVTHWQPMPQPPKGE